MKLVKANPEKKITMCIYGRDGVGKSSFGAKFPKPLFVGPEIDGADFLTDINGDKITKDDDTRTHKGLLETVESLAKDNQGFETLVLDSLDWIESEIQESLKVKYKVDNLNDAAGGYGGGYRESFELQINLMKALMKLKSTMNIVAVAHSNETKKSDSIVQAEWVRTDLKLHESTNISPRAMWREAFDAVVFIDQEVAVESEKNNKVKTSFNSNRILRFEGTERFAAKNRWPGFPNSIKFLENDDIYSVIKNLISRDLFKEAMDLYASKDLNKPNLKKFIEENSGNKTILLDVINKIKKGE